LKRGTRVVCVTSEKATRMFRFHNRTMRWSGRRQSDNIEDRRGVSPKAAAGGLGAVGVILAIAYVVITGDTSALQNIGTPSAASAPLDPELEKHYREFVGVTLADTEEVWTRLFRESGKTYEEPRLVLFSGSVESACGFASAAVGPFYCGEDRQVYIDLAFFDQMKTELGAKGDFAQAYVIAHEVGHHIQNLLGTLSRVHERRRRMSEVEANRLTVRLELQADYFAGVWAHHAQRLAGLDRSDIEEGMDAANAIGDDTLQKRARGYVVPDAFTHGTSEQRIRWFMKGFQSGDFKGGDTFSVRNP
jgi:uncharacterized protein